MYLLFLCRPILSVIILMIDKLDSPFVRSSDFVNHSYNYRPNWTPLGPIGIINCMYRRKEQYLIGWLK